MGLVPLSAFLSLIFAFVLSFCKVLRSPFVILFFDCHLLFLLLLRSLDVPL